MKLHLKNILFFIFFFSLLTTGSANRCYAPDNQTDCQSIIFQETSSLPDIENTTDTNGILESLKLTERNFAGSNTIKINKKQGTHNSAQKFFAHSADHFRSYHSRHINSLSPIPLYITIRSLII